MEANFTRLVNSDDYRAFINAPLVLIEASVNVASDVTKSQINVGGPKAEDIKLRYGDTPIVRILLGAQKFYNEQKAGIELAYDALKARSSITATSMKRSERS